MVTLEMAPISRSLACNTTGIMEILLTEVPSPCHGFYAGCSRVAPCCFSDAVWEGIGTRILPRKLLLRVLLQSTLPSWTRLPPLTDTGGNLGFWPDRGSRRYGCRLAGITF